MQFDKPKITIKDKSKCLISGVREVKNYSCDQLIVCFGKYSAKILGCDFCIEELTEDCLILNGTILQVGFVDE